MYTIRILIRLIIMLVFSSCRTQEAVKETTPDDILLKDFKPVSSFNIPVTTIKKAKYPVNDMHTHGRYAKTRQEVEDWVRVMDETGVEKAVVLTQAHGEKFDELVELYSAFPDRFELWCGFDYSGF